MDLKQYRVVLRETDARPIFDGLKAVTVNVLAVGPIDARDIAELHFGGRAVVANEVRHG